MGGTGWGGNSQLPAGNQNESIELGLRLESGLPGEGVPKLDSAGTLEAGERFWPLLPKGTGLSASRGEVTAPPWGGRTGPQSWKLPGTWKMPMPWFLLSLALGRSPVVLSLERLVGPQDTVRCSQVSLEPWEGWGSLRVQSEAHEGPSWLLSLPPPSKLPWLVCLVLMG